MPRALDALPAILRARIERVRDDRAREVGSARRVHARPGAGRFEVTGDLDAALALLDRGRAVAADGAADRASPPPIRGQRGLLLLRSGDAGRRRWRPSTGPRVDRRRGPATTRSSILLNRGVLHLERGALDRAPRRLRSAARDRRADGDQRLRQSKARHNLGYVDFLAGRMPRALAAIERGRAATGDRTRSRCSTGPGCCARRDWSGDADRHARAGGRDLFAEARLFQDLARDRAGARRVRAGRAGPERGQGLRARRRTAGSSAGATCGGSARPSCCVLRCDRSRSPTRRRRAGRRTALRGVAVARRRARRRDCRREGRRRPGPDRRAAGGRVPAAAPGAARRRPLPPLRAERHAARPGCRPARSAPWPPCSRERHQAGAGRGAQGAGRARLLPAPFGSLDLRTASAVHGAALARLGLERGAWRRPPGRACFAASSGPARSRPGCRRCGRRATSAPPSCWPSCARSRRRRAGSRASRARRSALARLRAGPPSLQRDDPGPGLGARGRPRLGDRRRPARPRSARPRRGTRLAFVTYARAPRPVGRGRASAGRRSSCSTWPSMAEVDDLVQPGARGPRRAGDAAAPAAAPGRRPAAPRPGPCAARRAAGARRCGSAAGRWWSPAAATWCSCPGACCPSPARRLRRW